MPLEVPEKSACAKSPVEPCARKYAQRRSVIRMIPVAAAWFWFEGKFGRVLRDAGVHAL
jgi:hypothetical protein